MFGWAHVVVVLADKCATKRLSVLVRLTAACHQ
jgi:hypothetical protein